MGMIPPAIFALYFLKLKRQPLEVPSTYLWHRVIEDLHVNSLWQRLRKSLLLFLQLLVVGLAILALLRPGWQGQTLQGQQFIFLVDNSASMSTADGEGGAPRLQEAKQRVGSFIDQLDSNMSAMIISFAEQPDVVQEFTSDRRQLREALQRIVPSSAQTDLAAALKLADGFANPKRVTIEEDNVEFDVSEQREIDLYIVSDGRFQSVEDFSLGNLNAHYLPIGTGAAENAAITAFNTRRNEEFAALEQAFVQVYNSSKEDLSAVVELYLNDALLDAANVEVPAGAIGSTTFNLNSESIGVLRAEIDPGPQFKDVLALDNVAYTVLERERHGRVLLVTPGNRALESVLSTERSGRLAHVDKVGPDTLESEIFSEKVQSDRYDLVIFDRCAPRRMPQANTVFVGRRPPLQTWTNANESESTEVAGPQIIDWERGHPLTALLELGGTLIAESLIVRPPPGGRVLVDSTAGPLVSVAPRDQFQDVAIGFEIVGKNEQGESYVNTDWHLQHSFPNFWFNVLEFLAAGDEDIQLANRPEKPVELRLDTTADEVEVAMPDKSTKTVPVDQASRIVVQDTDLQGIYDILSDGQTVKRFAVNLFDREESDVALRFREEGENGLNVVESLSIGFVDVVASSPQTEVRREMWKPLLLVALFVLLLEWYIYNRRVYI